MGCPRKAVDAVSRTAHPFCDTDNNSSCLVWPFDGWDKACWENGLMKNRMVEMKKMSRRFWSTSSGNL